MVDARPLIGDVDGQCVDRVTNGDGHRAGAVAGGVVEEHVEDLAGGGRGRMRRRKVGGDADPQRAPRVGEAVVPGLARVLEEPADIEWLAVAGGVTGQGEEVVDGLPEATRAAAGRVNADRNTCRPIVRRNAEAFSGEAPEPGASVVKVPDPANPATSHRRLCPSDLG